MSFFLLSRDPTSSGPGVRFICLSIDICTEIVFGLFHTRLYITFLLDIHPLVSLAEPNKTSFLPWTAGNKQSLHNSSAHPKRHEHTGRNRCCSCLCNFTLSPPSQIQ